MNVKELAEIKREAKKVSKAKKDADELVKKEAKKINKDADEAKKVKSTKTNIKINNINTMITNTFIQPEFRRNVLENIILNKHLSSKKLFQVIMFDNNMNIQDNYTRQGFVFETICQILVITKSIVGLNYIEIFNCVLTFCIVSNDWICPFNISI